MLPAAPAARCRRRRSRTPCPRRTSSRASLSPSWSRSRSPNAEPEPEPRTVAEEAPPEPVHQPTVEYTPFQTEEHEAPLGEPREDEPRLVATRGRPRDEVPAYAVTREDTAEHDGFDETDERPIVPLRRAPARAAIPPRRRPAPAVPRRRPPTTPRTGGGRHWGRRILLLIVLVVFGVALYAANKTFQPFHSEGEGTVAVTIPEGADAGEIGKILAAAGVVDSARFFEINATINGDRGKLRPGKYTLQRDMKNADAIAALQVVPKGPKPIETVDVRLLEGPSRKENAPVVDDSNKVKGSYAKATASKSTMRRIRELGAPKGTKTAEGFLFPATYTIPEGSTANRLVKEQLDAFEENFKQVDLSNAKKKNLTRYDVIIIASMIEREAQLARERPLVSAVIYNRLKEGMTLGIDATIRYATNNWKRPIRVSELENPGPVQHTPQPRAAAHADRQPRARVVEGRRQACEQGLPLLRPQGQQQVRRARVLLNRRGVRQGPRAL